MFVAEQLDSLSRQEFYTSLVEQAKHLVEGEPNWIANLSNLSALLKFYLQDVNWAGFYLLDPVSNDLVLGPFQGLPACLRIPIGKGVCGTAAAKNETLRVNDVNQFPGHIACDGASQSEIVVPLCKNGQVIGVLDIDSPILSRFDEDDEKGLEQFAKIAESCL